MGDVNMAWEQCCVGRGVGALRHKGGSATYTFCAVSALQPEIQQYQDTGTVFGAITKKLLAALPIVEPPAVVIDEFHRHVLPLDQRIRQATAQIRTLGALRDTLLPGLVSGEVRVGLDSAV